MRDKLTDIASNDVTVLLEKEKSYGGSWKKRGGVGAYMMLARKWDRLENFLEKFSNRYDIFAAIAADSRDEGLLDDIRDLRRYLMLVEMECVSSTKWVEGNSIRFQEHNRQKETADFDTRDLRATKADTLIGKTLTETLENATRLHEEYHHSGKIEIENPRGYVAADEIRPPLKLKAEGDK